MSGKPNWRKGLKASEEKPKEPKAIPQSTEIVSVPTNHVNHATSPQIGGLHTNPQDSTALVFFDVMQEFASASAEVWPTDTVLKDFNASLVSAQGKKLDIGKTLGKKFHEHFASLYPKILAKDGSVFSESFSAELSELNLAGKYASSPQEIRDTVWEYLRSMVQYAGMLDMYSKCPQGMLDSISAVAGGLIGKLQNGELDASNLNPLQLGQMMMQDLSPEELEGFGNAIMNGGNMESMMSIVQSSMGSMGGMPGMPGMGGMPGIGGAGMPDLSMLSGLFGKK